MWGRKRREAWQKHNTDDFYCIYWTGDRAGVDLRAHCSVCNPRKAR